MTHTTSSLDSLTGATARAIASRVLAADVPNAAQLSYEAASDVAHRVVDDAARTAGYATTAAYLRDADRRRMERVADEARPDSPAAIAAAVAAARRGDYRAVDATRTTSP